MITLLDKYDFRRVHGTISYNQYKRIKQVDSAGANDYEGDAFKKWVKSRHGPFSHLQQ